MVKPGLLSKCFHAFFWGLVAGAGILGGIALAVTIDLKGAFLEKIALPIARNLDRDLIHLKNGQTIEGRILSRTPTETLVGLEKGTVSFRPEEIVRIEENASTRYFKKAW